ncbi:MAG: hypothetical protein CVV33_07525 [Methanomicrobiales archaeon HGW-Methanomicrobiales-4]|nr:MAG: hypothetical protein CVV33_07525 [Methanomicrobiales archaeon HGW-Methanomicrobiales-4]
MKQIHNLADIMVYRDICKHYGIETTSTQVSGEILEPRICPHCREMNSPVSSFCHLVVRLCMKVQRNQPIGLPII